MLSYDTLYIHMYHHVNIHEYTDNVTEKFQKCTESNIGNNIFAIQKYREQYLRQLRKTWINNQREKPFSMFSQIGKTSGNPWPF